MNKTIKYFQNPTKPEQVLGVIECTYTEKLIAEQCGWIEILPTFINKDSTNE